MGIFSRKKIDIKKTLAYLKKNGLHPVVEGEEIRWETKGKTNSLRIYDGCQLQIYREYPMQEEIFGKFENAASRTMDEIFSAKVGVRRLPGDSGCIYFAAEVFCTSIKDLDIIIPESINILDAAEDRQRENLKDLLSSEAEAKPRRRIGFVQGYMEKED